MLHGYTQSGPLFHAKTRALEKRLQKAFPGTTLFYPTGPRPLNPFDVPGFGLSGSPDSTETEAYAWWQRSDTADPPEYVGLNDGLASIAKVLMAEGPFDGVIGFSQGAACAGLVSSLLEGNPRREAFSHFRKSEHSLSMPFPSSFESLQHPPMKFCVAYSGFIAPGERYLGFYNEPKIQTPTCHFIGSLDSVVEESRSKAFIDACGGEEHSRIIYHPGGHFIPSSRQYLDTLVEFITSTTTSESFSKERADNKRAEDMEVPF